MENEMNHTTTGILNEKHLSRTTSIICGTVILLISISGLIVYLLFIIIALGRKKFQRNSYFTMAGWLGVADCICLVLMITYAAPCVIIQKDISDLKMIGGILNIGWFSGLPLIVFLAANRFFCICHTECFKTLFTCRKTRYYCLSALIFGTSYSLPSFMKYCPLYFNHHMMSWEWKTEHAVSKYITFGEITIVMVVTLTTHTLNILVFRKIRALHKTSSSQDMKNKRKCLRERKIFMQFFMTTLWLPVFDIPFIALSYMEDPSQWLGFFVTIAYTINCSINGWVYLIVNNTVQRQIKKMVLSPKQYMRNCAKDETPSNTDDLSEDGRNSTMPLKNNTSQCCRDKYANTSHAAHASQVSSLLMMKREHHHKVDMGPSLKKITILA